MTKRIFNAGAVLLPGLAMCALFLVSHPVSAQVNARLFQHPDVSTTHITFTFGGDLWVVPKTGGMASRLSSPPGPETYPRFSPDGSRIAFSGNYDGNSDVYVLPLMGGVPKRLTYHEMADRVIDWHPTADKVLFASSRESGRQRFSQFFLIPAEGGLARKMPLPHAEFGTFNGSGDQMVYTDKSRLNRTWKRYRGGMAPDLILFDLGTSQSRYLTESDANEELPMWHGNSLYFLSDRGAEKRFNLWSMDLETNEIRQLTSFNDFDVHRPSLGPEDIVFEAGGSLYLMELATETIEEVQIQVVTDLLSLAPRAEKTESVMMGAAVSPAGNRAVVNARGELFSVPSEHGYVKNLTNSSGIAERYPQWSPDGKYIAYWSDRSGEYELMLLEIESGKEEQLTNYGPGFRYRPFWSPDSKKIAFIDQSMKIWIFDRESGMTRMVDQCRWINHGGLSAFPMSWSSDSRWLAYSRSLDSQVSVIFLYDMNSGTLHQVTSGFYSDMNPVFDPEGNYLYLVTNRSFRPVYSDFGNEFIYPNATGLAAVSLRNDVASPLESRNDEVEAEEEEKSGNGEEEQEEKGRKKKKKSDKEEGDNGEEEETVEIDLEGFESRMVMLPPRPGNLGSLQAAPGKVLFHRSPNSGSGERNRPIMFYDLKEREEKTILATANSYALSANGEKLLAVSNGKMAIISVAADQKMDKPLRTGEMEMTVVPREEYRQIFLDAWRFQRDYFYDKGLHGVDWNLMKERYGAMVEDAVTRSDVNFIIGELIGELNASHTYRGGGDLERAPQRNVGYLGVNWSLENGYYRIKEIITAAPWETEARSPLSLPGCEVEQGDYLLAVNGVPVDISKEPYAAFQGLAERIVELTVSSDPGSAEPEKVLVELMNSETRLRHLAWIENNRKRVAASTGDRAGYIYVRSTGRDGQNELVRQFSAQFRKEALIIDERFNSGGQIPDRFVELLNRKPLAYWAVRDADDQAWPPTGHFGPKVMLINGWSGSGGDAFPDYFRKEGLGPLIGSRTWGGLIGISGAPMLVDGGMVTVPTFRMFDPDGAWFREGHGVDADIEVREDAGELARGTDVQLERAIEEINRMLEERPYIKPEHPPYETR